ncbi:MAG: D-alanyl-D-alanine carboxypeptidase/D-alanyl-D-alanine-endopeptidase [Oligoflexia bacterium]|nr:D-alanyl-D-alanine carboxypeptidase/D-alanyl-D-alanine-endopeptidase [Oligoflexia bacterium]
MDTASGPDVDLLGAEALDYPLESVLGGFVDDRLFSTADVGVQVVDLTMGDEAWAWNADQPLVPASVNKLLTTAVALRTLGPGWAFDTDLLTDGELNPDGVLEGDLYVRGGGDPTLVVEQLWKMAVDLQSYGVVEIDGDIVFDDSFFSDPGLIPGWNKAVDIANGPAYFAPLGALSVNYNTACLLVAAGSARNEPARVDLETPVSAIEVDNQVVTGSSRARTWLKVEREVADDGAKVFFTVSGVVPLGAETTHIYRAVGDPTAHFMAVFENMLTDRGLTWTGTLERGLTPADARVIVRHRSEPLGLVLARMNKWSSNIMAEQVLKAVAAVATDGPGSTAAGVELVRKYLDELGIPRDEYNLVNGSGLSRDVRLRPSQITAVMADLYQDQRVGPEFRASLSLAGIDGTLRRRLGGDLAGLVRGKTGSLNGVYCVAAYVHAGDGHVYALAFLVNGFRGSSRPVRDLQDRVAQALLAMDGRVVHGSN